MTSVLIKMGKFGHRNTDTQWEGYMKMKVEIKVILLAKECQ